MFDFYSFIRKKWSEYSRASGRKGTVLDDLAVKPSGLLMSDFYNSLVDQRTINNIAEYQSMTDDELDFFGNKFFNPRVEGSTAATYIRVYFDEKKDLTITDNFRAVSIKGNQYKAVAPGFISKSSFKLSDDTSALYYVDINIIAAAPGDNYVTEKNTITQLINIDFVYKFVTNPEATVGGSIHEDNQKYYDRLRYSLNDRSLVNKSSLLNIMKSYFPIIDSMYIAGAGDRFMVRDLLTATDLSKPIRRADYLGKLPGDNIVKHIAYYGIFPPNPGSFQSDTYWGPHSSYSAYNAPLTIEPSTTVFNPNSPDIRASDAAFYGFPLEQEADVDMYRGLFFNDYKRYMEVKTSDLFNISNERIGFVSVQVPNDTWIYGTNGSKKGNFNGLVSGVSASDVLNFNNQTINFSGGCSDPVVAGKDILKRTGVKLTGSFVWPAVTLENVNSKLQIMIGGVASDTVDGYTGLGFGVMVTKDYNQDDLTETNAVVYFAHSEQYGGGQVFASQEDWTNHGFELNTQITGMNALSERAFRIEPEVEYEFEFILHDDLRMTLYFNKVTRKVDNDPTGIENEMHFQLPGKALYIFSSGIKAVTTTRYGTIMKASLETTSIVPTDTWQIINLRAFDINPARAMALCAVNVKDLEDPVAVYLRAYGQGVTEGYQCFVWDKESQFVSSSVNSELTRGGWLELGGVSNPDGSKTSVTGLLNHSLGNLNRYRMSDGNVYFLIIASGKSLASIRYNGDLNEDFYSLLRIEYIKVESDNIDTYHSNTKSDFYVSTIKNFEEYTPLVETLINQGTYFELNGPVFKVLSVSLNGEILSEADYTVIDPDENLTGSYLEKKRIVLVNSTATEISVEYIKYPEITRIQSFFDNQIYGNTLVKHKFPCFLSFTFYFAGSKTQNEIADEIKKYIDQNVDGVFSVNNMIADFYNRALVTNIKTPIEISYRKFDDNGEEVTGTFNDTLTIRNIDFFNIESLSVQKL